MSSNNLTENKARPLCEHIWSVRTLFLLIITGITLFLALILLWSGAGIMQSIITQYSNEIMNEKLNALISPLELRYATLQHIGLEDNFSQRKEIKDNALKKFASYRYKETGSVFVVGKDQTISLSQDFLTRADKGFSQFFTLLQTGSGTMEYTADDLTRFAVYQFYPPWESYIGLAINKGELFALKKLYINIVITLLTAVLLAIFLFSGFIQRLIITPLIRLTNYANQISKGNYDTNLEGKFILELGALKIDIQQMVSTLRQKMDQETAQLQIIKERERWLDDAVTALQESEKKYRTIYNAPADAILIYDPELGNILDANKAMYSMFGYHHDEIDTLGFADLSSGEPPFTRQEAEKKVISALERGPQLYEWKMRKKDGELFWSEISLQSTYIEAKKRIIAVVRNIQGRKVAEEELASEKERLAVTLHSIGDGVITTDVHGRIVLMNRVAEMLTGWNRAEAIGCLFTDVFHVVHQETGEKCENPVDKVFSSGKKVELDDNTILVSKDGTHRQVACSGAPICDPLSRVSGAVIVLRDVTEEKRLEEELFKVKKLESVGVLAGGIAHDFNNILVAILGNLGLAQKHLDDPQEAKTLLFNTERAALRAKDLTAQLLTFSKGGEPIIKTVSIGPVIRESAEFVLQGSNVMVVFDIPDDLWLVKVDSGQISQVVQNIVLNARQAMPEEGTVEISCRNCQDCGVGPDSVRQKCVRVVISDNGPGIPADIISKIFDPYYSTKDDGSGLGLAICHSIIKKHGGNITVESQPGGGAAFTIQLPVSREQNIEQPVETPLQGAFGRKARILVMDDEEMILELTKQMLEYMGHEVVTCTNGQAALDLYQKAMAASTPYDLVIMDLTIPGGMGGERTVKELLHIDPNARAIVSSGYSNDPVMSEYSKYGFKAVVVKPYQMEDLDKAVQNTLMS